MDLTTRCPQCGTAFEASLADLQLRKGYIRCVQCAHIFDGYAEVVSGPGPAQAGPDVPRVERRSPPPPEPRIERRAVPAPVPPEPDFSTGPEPDIFDPAADEPQVFRSSRAAPEPMPGPGPFRVEPQIGPEDRPAPFVVEGRPGYRGQGGTAAPLLPADEGPPWWDGPARLAARLLLLVLLLLLAAQLVYVYRAQLAQAAPSLRPWLQRACVPLRCQVPYARDLAQITITGSALKIQEPPPEDRRQSPPAAGQESQRFVLQATLRNQSAQAQEWPTIVLDLKDAAGTLLVRRNLSPADYLGAEAASHPFAAGGEVLVQVPLTLSGMRINGYQLELFYP